VGPPPTLASVVGDEGAVLRVHQVKARG